MSARRLDRQIRTAQARLEGIDRRETWALTPGEQARLVGNGAAVIARSSRRAQQAMAEIWEGAERRLVTEITEATKAREAAESEAAARKAARRRR